MSAAWKWSIVLVAALQLVTLAGCWYIEDHVEILFMTRRLLHQGTVTMWRPGEPPNPFLNVVPGQASWSRFLPVNAFVLLPLLAADEVLGWGDRAQYGRLVHLQGWLFAVATLFWLGRTLRRDSASSAATALAVALTGLSWPMWLISKRVGPEPILALLALLFASADPETRSGRIARALIAAGLPWCHATGAVISFGLAFFSTAEGLLAPPRTPDRIAAAFRRSLPALACSALGIASVMYLWNYRIHGHWLSGGYGHYTGPTSGRELVNPLAGLLVHLNGFGGGAAPLLVPALIAALLARRKGAPVPGLVTAAGLTLLLLAFLSPLSSPEPARRLAVTVPLWGLVLGCSWDRHPWPSPWPQILIALVIPWSLACLIAREGFAYLMPDGSIYFPPHFLWLRLAGQGAPLTHTLLPVLLLCTVALVALDRVYRLFRPVAIPVAPGAATP
jgi:hypothetical protein